MCLLQGCQLTESNPAHIFIRIQNQCDFQFSEFKTCADRFCHGQVQPRGDVDYAAFRSPDQFNKGFVIDSAERAHLHFLTSVVSVKMTACDWLSIAEPLHSTKFAAFSIG